MPQIELRPLTKEEITQLGLSNHDLWVIKQGQEISGPFEAESLKKYAFEHSDTFSDAQASRLDHNDWQPIFSHAIFQRPEVQTPADQTTEESQTYDGPYWIIHNGLKSQPLNQADIFKKIEMGLLTMMDEISCNEGKEWKKLHEVSPFNQKHLEASQLPQAPVESSFQEVRAALIERVESSNENPSAQVGLAAMTYLTQDKSRSIKIEEITVEIVKETEVSKSLKWAIPAALAGCFALGMLGLYFFTPNPEGEETITNAEIFPPTQDQDQNQGESPSRKNRRARRNPASSQSLLDAGRASVNQQNFYPNSQFPTHIETHQNNHHAEPEPIDERDHQGESADDGSVDRGPAQEPSLVGNGPVASDNMSLDEAMASGSIPTPDAPVEEPVIDQASDF